MKPVTEADGKGSRSRGERRRKRRRGRQFLRAITSFIIKSEYEKRDATKMLKSEIKRKSVEGGKRHTHICLNVSMCAAPTDKPINQKLLYIHPAPVDGAAVNIIQEKPVTTTTANLKLTATRAGNI